MKKSGLVKLMESFADMPDPRVVGRTDHHLLDILVLTMCAVVCGADDWEAVEMWGEAKLDWLRQYIPLKNGIPSHDTIRKITMNLLRQDTSMKRSIPKKRLYAALHDQYLADVLGLCRLVI